MECRIAVESDKSGVLEAFPGIHRGMDYLPSEYDYFMACPRYTSYIGEIDGRIVAFMTTTILDDNKAYLIRAERVHTDYRGRGFINQLTAYANEHVTRHLVGPKIYKKFAYNFTEENIKKLERHPERKIIAQRPFLLYTVNIEEMGQILPQTVGGTDLDIIEINNLTIQEKVDVKKYFTRYCQASGGVMCINFTPYGHGEENWDDILENTNLLATQRSGLQGDLNQVQDMILVIIRKCEVGIRCDIEIISADPHLAGLSPEKIGYLLKTIHSKVLDTRGKIAFWIFCSEQYIEGMDPKVVAVLGKKYSVAPETVFHVIEELQV